MQISQIGEFGLIQRIKSALPHPPAEVIVGIGDDVAVLKVSESEYLLATCDVQVENVHFSCRTISPYQLGRRIAAINVSDIAAMAGAPSWALVSLALPEELDTGFVDALYEGMHEQLGMAGAVIVGGNLSRIDKGMVIDLCLLGKVAPANLLLRSGARLGDLILVTGWLGDSRAGFELIRRPELTISENSREQVVQRHLTPQPRLGEGQELGNSALVHALVDVSDGLLSDLRHICRASRVGAEIWLDHLPISSAAKETAGAAGQDVSAWALAGGEDYELLFTASPDSSAAIQSILKDRIGTWCHVIGKVIDEAEDIQLFLENGEKMVSPEGFPGWDHFSAAQLRDQQLRAKS
jgi:thiamine-monophosphate kinase